MWKASYSGCKSCEQMNQWYSSSIIRTDQWVTFLRRPWPRPFLCIVSLEVEMALDLDPEWKQNPHGKGTRRLLEEDYLDAWREIEREGKSAICYSWEITYIWINRHEYYIDKREYKIGWYCQPTTPLLLMKNAIENVLAIDRAPWMK